MGRYRKKADGSRLYLPGYGRVRDGDVVEGNFDAVKGLEKLAEESAPAEPTPAPPYIPMKTVSTPAPKPAPKPAPAPVAEPEPEPEPASFPIEDYDDMNVSEALEAIAELVDEDEVLAVFEYEQAHKNRKGVLSGIEELLVG